MKAKLNKKAIEIASKIHGKILFQPIYDSSLITPRSKVIYFRHLKAYYNKQQDNWNIIVVQDSKPNNAWLNNQAWFSKVLPHKRFMKTLKKFQIRVPSSSEIIIASIE
jgi:hypothetical protein